MKKAVIIYGAPGSGKGTIAELLVKNFGFLHFDTGRYIREILNDPKLQENKTIQREKKLNEAGTLNTPTWVFKIVSQAVKKIAAAGWPVVFSGSPRTFLETFGDGKQKGLMHLLTKLYGKKNIFIFEMKIKPETSVERNSNRFICEICGQPNLFLYTGRLPCCAFCAGPLKKRKDDDPQIIKNRILEYEKRTQPIFERLKKENYSFFEIDAEPVPFKIYQKAREYLKL